MLAVTRHAIPAVSYGILDLLPRCLASAFETIPAGPEVGLDVIPCLALVLHRRVVSVSVTRPPVVEVAVGARVRTGRIVVAPVGFLGRPVKHGARTCLSHRCSPC